MGASTDKERGKTMKGYTLNSKGNLEMLQITVEEDGENTVFTSPLERKPYTLNGVSLAQFEEVIEQIGHHELTSDLLNMIGSLGGDLWDDDPDGTSTSYDYFPETKTLCVVEG